MASEHISFCKLPHLSQAVEFRVGQPEPFTQLEDYWMKREGLIFFPFDRNKAAYFLSSDEGDKKDIQVEGSRNGEISKEEFTTTVMLAQHEMRSGSLEKVVLARSKHIKQEVEPLEIFERAVELHPNSYVYLVDLGWEQWVGASPELLIQYNGEILETMALAGTVRSDESFGPKEVEEQQMVESFIEQKLELLGLTTGMKTERVELPFGQLKHLQTRYMVKASPLQALDAVKHLHPTSAVCGLPRDKSFQFIQDYEALDRAFYSGITGLVNKHSATFFVNLRCMRILNDEVELFAGAGVTAASDPEKEWDEIEQKLSSIEELIA